MTTIQMNSKIRYMCEPGQESIEPTEVGATSYAISQLSEVFLWGGSRGYNLDPQHTFYVAQGVAFLAREFNLSTLTNPAQATMGLALIASFTALSKLGIYFSKESQDWRSTSNLRLGLPAVQKKM